MRDIVNDLAGGKGKVTRYIIKLKCGNFFKTEFGILVLDPLAIIGEHSHKDVDGWRHCEIYFAVSRMIYVNVKRKVFSVCRNSKHKAANFSTTKKGVIIFLKLWW